MENAISCAGLTDQKFPFGAFQAIAPRPKSMDRSYIYQLRNVNSENVNSTTILQESMDIFIGNPNDENFNTFRGEVRKFNRQPEYVSFFSEVLDTFEHKVAGKGRDVKSDVLNILFEGVDPDDTSLENLVIGEKLVEMVHRMVVIDRDKMSKDREETVNSVFERPSEWGYKDARYLIYRGIFENKVDEKGKTVAGYMMAKYGVSLFLDNVKQIVYDEKLNQRERDSANNFLHSFWEGIVPIKKGEVVLDWNKFYAELSSEFHPMTEEREGSQRVDLILDIFRRTELVKDALIVDVGSGSGWLTRALEREGFHNTVGIENNDRYLGEARKKGGTFKKGDFHYLWRALDKYKLKPQVEIVNGRTIMHFKEAELMQVNAPIVIFDSLDPNTGAAKQKMDKFRNKLTEYGFDKRWLEENFWNILGTQDGGNHLGERLALPENYIKRIFGRHHAIEVVREKNYDGKGTDNLVYICTSGLYAEKIHGDRILWGDALAELNGNIDTKIKKRRNVKANKFYTNGEYAAFGY